MEFVRTERNGNLLIVVLGRGKANALNRTMIGELALAIANAETDPAVRGVVLASDRPRFFSSGFDVVEVFGYPRDEMRSFFEQFGGFAPTFRGLVAGRPCAPCSVGSGSASTCSRACSGCTRSVARWWR